jgi:folate/biopterin transporter
MAFDGIARAPAPASMSAEAAPLTGATATTTSHSPHSRHRLLARRRSFLARWLAAGPAAAAAAVARSLGLTPNRELVAVALAYGVQGVKIRMAGLAESYLLKDGLGLSPAAVTSLLAVAHVPWVVKPLYGFVSDNFPIAGERRRPYLVACGLVGSAAFWALGSGGLATLTPRSACALITLTELAVAFSDVVVDAVVVEQARGEAQATAGALQSLCWGAQAVGSLASAYAAGWVIDRAGPRPVLAGMAAFPLLVAAAAAFIREVPWSPPGAVGGGGGGGLGPSSAQAHAPAGLAAKLAAIAAQARALAATLARPDIAGPALFIWAYHASPSAGQALFFFYSEPPASGGLGFSPEFIGRIQLLDGLASLAGVAAFNAYLRRVPLRTIFVGVTWASAVAGLTQLVLVTRANLALGLSDKLFVAGDSVLLTALGRIALMPCLVLAARICPPGVEGALFAALMSLSNAGGGAGELIGAALTARLGVKAGAFEGLPALVAICAVASLLPLALVGLVGRAGAVGAAAEDEGEGGGGGGGAGEPQGRGGQGGRGGVKKL